MVSTGSNEGHWHKYAKAARVGLARALACFTGLILLLAFFLVTEHNIAPKFRKCVTDITKQESAKNPNDRSENVARTQIICTVSLINRDSDFFALLGTIIIAGFTGTLWLTTSKQAALTRESIDLAREEFVATHRPLITIRAVHMYVPSDSKVTVIRFLVQNTGSSLAKILEIIFYMACKRENGIVWPIIRVKEPILPIDIKAGFDFHALCNGEPELTEFLIGERHLLRAVTKEEIILHFRITVNYQDTFGNRRQTSAYREYDFTESRFQRVTNSEYEYQT
jgi:hypothetical protein